MIGPPIEKTLKVPGVDDDTVSYAVTGGYIIPRLVRIAPTVAQHHRLTPHPVSKLIKSVSQNLSALSVGVSTLTLGSGKHQSPRNLRKNRRMRNVTVIVLVLLYGMLVLLVVTGAVTGVFKAP